MVKSMPPARRVVFLHGWTMRGAIFDDLIAMLPSSYECHAPDLPGHGSRQDGEPDLATAADCLAELLQSRDLGDVVLVGWSLGAATAWEYVERHGVDRIAGLMTVDMSPRLACDAQWQHGLKGQDMADLTDTAERLEKDWHGMAEAIAATMFGHGGGAESHLRQRALEQILTNDRNKMVAMWKSLIRMDRRAVIARLPFPVLATCGALSRVYPNSAAEWLAATAPGGTMHVFAKSGHTPHLEEPAAFSARLVAFAEKL